MAVEEKEPRNISLARKSGSNSGKVLNFRRSEIDSGAFWDAFPAWQGI